jgi:hypothetical protein
MEVFYSTPLYIFLHRFRCCTGCFCEPQNLLLQFLFQEQLPQLQEQPRQLREQLPLLQEQETIPGTAAPVTGTTETITGTAAPVTGPAEPVTGTGSRYRNNSATITDMGLDTAVNMDFPPILDMILDLFTPIPEFST